MWDLGTGSSGYQEAEYDEITRVWALNAARAFAGLGNTKEEKFVFCYLSGQGADQREGKAYAMFGRVKGKVGASEEGELSCFHSFQGGNS